MKRFSIQLKNPCDENREEMTSTELGKFCLACQKEVIDFTKMSDAEIISFFKSNKNKCGTFKTSQLNRNLYPVAPPHSQRPIKYFFASLLSLNFLSASASLSVKQKAENDSIAIVVDSNIAKEDSSFIKTSDSLVVSNLKWNDSVFKNIAINSYEIIGRDIVTSGVPLPMEYFRFDSTIFNSFKNGIFTIVYLDTLKKWKFPQLIISPFISAKSIRQKKKNQPYSNVRVEENFVAVIPKRIISNRMKKWFEWI